MATNTYVALDTKTIANNTTTYIDFTSIPQTYTDLVLVANIKTYSATGNYIYAQWGNGSIDTGTNYSTTVMTGTGSSAISNRWANRSNFNMDYYATPETEIGTRILQIMNYSNTTTYKTALNRAVRAGGGTDATVGTWRSTAAINTLRITTDLNFFASGTTFTLYGIAAASAPTAKATGGTITYDVGYTYHTFTSSGTFTPTVPLTADILLVAGGGGGGSTVGGGGGAGGVLGFASQSLSSAQTVTIGGGGAGASNASPQIGVAGSNSQFGSLTASIGGGYGGSYFAHALGGSGGSGGGSNSVDGAGGAGTSGQGYAGGNGLGGSNGSGGGGGASGAGGANNNGGTSTNSITNLGAITQMLTTTGTGYQYTIAGGGGGGANGTGGTTTGGGGTGGSANGTGSAATANTGSGGGGGGGGGNYAGGSGGSGIIIVRYAN